VLAVKVLMTGVISLYLPITQIALETLACSSTVGLALQASQAVKDTQRSRLGRIRATCKIPRSQVLHQNMCIVHPKGRMHIGSH
jgi:hypothetical protein